MASKICSKCQEEKGLESFSLNSKGALGRKSVCKSCSNRQQRAFTKRKRLEDPEAWTEYRWEKHLKSAYGLTKEDYTSLLKVQWHRCKICGSETNSVGSKLFVDHCHSTGTVRGLLCYHCNSLLGLAKDDTSILYSAIKYLKEER